MGSCCSTDVTSTKDEANLSIKQPQSLSKTQVEKLIKIQAWWRGNHTRKSLSKLDRK
jgi:IQ calmodulin-binding motif